jgi:hypothetical protein
MMVWYCGSAAPAIIGKARSRTNTIAKVILFMLTPPSPIMDLSWAEGKGMFWFS